jgi:hypothetical protein
MAWLVRGVLPASGLACIFGASGSGKTFLAIDLAVAIANSPAWFGHPIKAAPVVYVALEGEAGIGQRVKAWQSHHGLPPPTKIRFVIRPVSLKKLTDADELAAEILQELGAGCVVFVDTLNRAAPGTDENSSVDMGNIIATAKRLSDGIKGLVVLVHHTGKDATKGMRGHSSMFAALDAAIEVTRDARGRSWKVAKSKDSCDDVTRGFELVPVSLGIDEWGLEITSCAICSAIHTAAIAPPRGRHQQRALEVIMGLCSGSQSPAHGVATADAETAVAARLDCETKRRGENARRAISDLIDSGHLYISDGVISTR